MDISESDSSDTSTNHHEYRLIVSNLAHDISRKDLEEHIGNVGEITYFTKKEAIVGFSTPSAMKTVFKAFNGSQLKGKRMKLIEYIDRGRSRTRTTHARRFSSPSPMKNRRRETENVLAELTSPVAMCTESSSSTSELSDINKRKAEPLDKASKRVRKDRFRMAYRGKSRRSTSVVFRSSQRFRASSSSESSDNDTFSNSSSFSPSSRRLRRSVCYHDLPQVISSTSYDSNSRSTSEENILEDASNAPLSLGGEVNVQSHEESGSINNDVNHVSVLMDNLRTCY